MQHFLQMSHVICLFIRMHLAKRDIHLLFFLLIHISDIISRYKAVLAMANEQKEDIHEKMFIP